MGGKGEYRRLVYRLFEQYQRITQDSLVKGFGESGIRSTDIIDSKILRFLNGALQSTCVMRNNKVHILTSTRCFIWIPERNSKNLHIQVCLGMNTSEFETRRRH